MNSKVFVLGLSLLLSCELLFAQGQGLTVAPEYYGANTSVPPERSSLNRSIIELLNKLDELQKELRQLRGDFEVVNHELSGIKRRQRELYLDMDRRLRDVERVGAYALIDPVSTTKSGTSQQSVSDSTQPTASIKPLAPTSAEKDSYRSAWNLLKEGRYDRSVKAFGDFLLKFPKSSLAGNAQYWLGEANYVSRKYKRAVIEFKHVMTTYPDSLKRPDAMLKLGFTYYELKQWDKAREMLESVMQNHPKSSAARLAGIRLKRLQNEER